MAEHRQKHADGKRTWNEFRAGGIFPGFFYSLLGAATHDTFVIFAQSTLAATLTWHLYSTEESSHGELLYYCFCPELDRSSGCLVRMRIGDVHRTSLLRIGDKTDKANPSEEGTGN